MSDLSDGNNSERVSTMVPTNDSASHQRKSIPTSNDNHSSGSNNKSERRQVRGRKSTGGGGSSSSCNKDKVVEGDPSSKKHLAEENLLLKKHLRKQEEKIKLLATKLVRLVGERKNKEKRDEILIEEQKTRIHELEHQIANLRDKLQVSRQQLASYTRLIPHIPSSSRVHSATTPSVSGKVSSASKSKKNLGSSSGAAGGGSSSRPRPATTPATGSLIADHEFTSRVEQLLLEAKAENQALEDQLRVTRERLSFSEREVERVRGKVKEIEMRHQEELLRLKGQMDVDNDRHKKKKLLSDNIQLIRLQRETRRTSSWLSTMETQCRSLESTLSSANETIAQLESQVASLQDELREGQQKSLALQKELEDSGSQLSRMKELETQLHGLQEENKILKQTNESLVDKTFSHASERYRTRSGGGNGVENPDNEIHELKSQLGQIESSLKSELKSKAELLGTLSQEKTKSSQMEQTISELNYQLSQLRSQLESTQREVKTLEINSHTSQSQSQLQLQRPPPDHLLLDEIRKKQEEWEQELGQTQWQLVQVRDELHKTRNLLRTQMTINKEYQREIESLTMKLDRAETFHHERLQEFMKIMEQRAQQMSLLERTLENIHLNNTAVINSSNNVVNQKGASGTGEGPGGNGNTSTGTVCTIKVNNNNVDNNADVNDADSSANNNNRNYDTHEKKDSIGGSNDDDDDFVTESNDLKNME